jgi:virulence-associated protein VagC
MTHAWLSCLAVAGMVVDTAMAESRPVRGTANVACRLYIQDESGKCFFARSASPQGTAVVYDIKRSPTSHEQHTTLSAHPFIADLPPGKYTFMAERGKEYSGGIAAVTVPETGDVPEVKLSLTPWIEMHKQHWYSGDTHVHRKLEDLPNLLDAEDLHVALPLTYWVRGAYESPAQTPVGGHPEPKPIVVHSQLPHGAVRVIWPINTEYELFTVKGKSHPEGAVFVLNHKRPLQPAAPPVAPVAQAARDEGALLDLDKHSWNWSMMIVPLMNADLFELANNHVWRTEFLFKNWTIDMVPKDWEIETGTDGYTEQGWIDWGFKTYYALLNCGFRMRPTGGTGSGVHPVPLGFGRVYVECPEGFSYDAWIKGLDAGRSFVTTGPMLRATFDGQPLGTVFRDAKPHAVHIVGAAMSLRALNRIEIMLNGEIARVIEPQNQPSPELKAGAMVTAIDEQLPIKHSSWIALRCFERRKGAGERSFYAHTAPVHYEIDGPVRPRQREVDYFIHRMEQEIARNRGVLANTEVAEYEQALAVYREIARRAKP